MWSSIKFHMPAYIPGYFNYNVVFSLAFLNRNEDGEEEVWIIGETFEDD